MFDVWTPVQVSAATNARVGQAGTVFATNPKSHPDEVVVKFDKDGTTEAVALVDLVAL